MSQIDWAIVRETCRALLRHGVRAGRPIYGGVEGSRLMFLHNASRDYDRPRFRLRSDAGDLREFQLTPDRGCAYRDKITGEMIKVHIKDHRNADSYPGWDDELADLRQFRAEDTGWGMNDPVAYWFLRYGHVADEGQFDGDIEKFHRDCLLLKLAL